MMLLTIRTAAAVTICALLAVMVTPPSALAQELASPSHDAPAQTVKLHALGVQVAVDPETGRLRPPTQAEARELARVLREVYLQTPTARAPTIQHPDGSLTQLLDARHRFQAVVRLDERGNLEHACVLGDMHAGTDIARAEGTDTGAASHAVLSTARPGAEAGR